MKYAFQGCGAGTGSRTALVLGLALVLFTPPARAEGPAHRAGEVVIETGTVMTPEGAPVAYELGTLFVPENRTSPGSRLIGVGFARMKAARPTGAPPVFVLPGGPGRSYLNAFTDRDAAGQRQLAGLLPYRAAGDVVVIDQRGYSKRGDVLELASEVQPLDKPRSREADAAAMIQLARQAIAAHPDKDLSGYTIVQCAGDVDDLRRALGYRQIVLSGQSFGSQWSFAVMRLYPKTVARALLSGVEPLANSFDMPSQTFAALQRIAWDAEHDAGLAPYLPPGGLMGAVRAVRERLASGPITVELPDGTTGKARKVVLGLEDFQGALRRSASDWPSFVLSLYYRHYEDWARETVEQRHNIEGPVRLIEPLIDSSLGVSADREHLLRTDPGTEFLGVGDFDAVIASAAVWPTPDVGEALRLAEPSPIPVLFMHGDWDTSTPIENTLGMLPYFPNGRALLVHRGAHHTRAPVFEQQPEVLKQVLAFLKTGDTRGLALHVSLPVPTFRRPSFAAPARPGATRE
ncbi:alpha/beta hydrolase [Corallococcus llansteffanensis]|uniref:Alpha/beta fold hydrolase n=1 Tax=Corallococcus llansteffanensis TaxID=2316731 RepID=A0A3A8Q3D4_9BACT|nr:alpha/beta fold hydrolase [Corallococcus llansteffanensis]RKH63259.1 alpha/beta fold hydrolase [Corallococcus llansteffanensis]